MAPKESPIFVKTFDLLLWILERTRKFPRDQRFVLAKRIQDAALDLYDALLEAGRHREDRLTALRRADLILERLKVYVRLSERMRLLSTSQYEHLSRGLAEVGRLLGAWIKTCGR